MRKLLLLFVLLFPIRLWAQDPSVVNIIRNGDLEGNASENFIYRNLPIVYMTPADIVDGVGVDGSRGLKIETTAIQYENYDNEFWFHLNQPVSVGTRFKLTFDYRADNSARISLAAHCGLGGYIDDWFTTWVNFDTEWKSYTYEGSITSYISSDQTPFTSLSFHLNDFSEANNYYFDNIRFEVYLTDQCPKPTFTLNENLLSINSPFDATIYYTLDGSTPTTSSSVYTSPLVLNQNYTVKAIASVDGYETSSVATYQYKHMVNLINNSILEGSDVSNFFVKTGAGNINQAVITDGIGMYDDIRWYATRSIKVEATARESGYDDNQFFIRLNQPISAGTRYRVSFHYRADKRATAYYEAHSKPGECIYSYWGSVSFQPMWYYYSKEGTVYSSQSSDDKPLGSMALDLSTYAEANNYYFDNIKFEVYLDGQCPKPTFTTSDKGLSINSPFNATIYYTLDGSTPTTSSSVYTSPLVLEGNCTVKAIAIVDGYTASPVATYNYTLLFPDCPPGEIRDAAIYLYYKGIVEGENGLLLAEREAVRAEAAKTSFYGAYFGPANVPANLAVDNYPSVYSDLQMQDTNNSYYYRPAKALLYLEYGDGVAPFDRNRLAFDPEGKMARIYVLKELLETFNIKPEPDYISKAASLGIITSSENFRPYDNCTRGELFLMLARIMQKIEAGEIKDPKPQESDYFQPLNTTLKTISLGASLQLGNFQHYTKTSFALSGVVPLVFAHSYNSYNTTLPSVFYGDKASTEADDSYQPLGDGWSHNYHSFITVVGEYSSGTEDNGLRMIVHWGGGSIDVYKSENGKLVPESMGVYDELSLDGDKILIKSKSQTKYLFSILEGSGAAVFYLSSITDRNGNKLTINYENGQNSAKRISSVSDGNRSLTFSYLSGTNMLSEVKDPLNRSVKFEYFDNEQTGKKQLKSFTDAEKNTTTYDYADLTKTGASKLLSRIQLPKGNYIENEYDANMRLKKSESGINGVPTTKTSIEVTADYGSGSISTQSKVDVERGSQTSSYNYTFNGNNVVTDMTGAKDLYVNSTYGDSSHPELPTKMVSNSTESDVTYDKRGNVTSITVRGDGTLTTTMTYDDTTNNLTSITDPKGNKITYSYDDNGNLTGVSAPEGVTASITAYDKGLPIETIDPMGVKTTYLYNKYGNLTKITLPALDLSSSADYDDASRMTSVTDALGRTTSFVYNNNDFLTSETNALNRTTQYSYDANDNLTTITNAKGGVTTMSYDNATDWLTSVSFAGATKQYTYNKDGSLSTFTKPDGTTLTYEYDELGRVTSDGVNSYGYDSKLRLSSISGGGKTLTLTYDGFNRITSTSGSGHNNSYSYDKNGNCTSVNNTEYTYDGLNRLATVTFSGKTITYSYRKDSKLSKVTYPNGMTTTYDYDAVGRLTGKQTKLSNGKVIAGYSYKIDKVGNITEQDVQEPFVDLTMPDESVEYSYNNANRITKAGNISFGFDANGNTTKRGNETYTWDKQDRLTQAGSTTINYDPLGLIESYGDITFTTDPLGIGNVLSDSKSGAQYIYGNGLEARVINGKVSYYVTDVRGSVVAIVDESGNITHKYQYDEFGKVTMKKEADYNPFQYVGKYGVMALNNHLYYMRARHYDPTIGRFLSEDPIWSTNLYPYADNNPIMGIDPEGTISKRWKEVFEEKFPSDRYYNVLENEANEHLKEELYWIKNNYHNDDVNEFYQYAYDRRDNSDYIIQQIYVGGEKRQHYYPAPAFERPQRGYHLQIGRIKSKTNSTVSSSSYNQCYNEYGKPKFGGCDLPSYNSYSDSNASSFGTAGTIINSGANLIDELIFKN